MEVVNKVARLSHFVHAEQMRYTICIQNNKKRVAAGTALARVKGLGND